MCCHVLMGGLTVLSRACLSGRCVEQPFRHKPRGLLPTRRAAFVASAVAVDQAAHQQGTRGVVLASHACPPLLGVGGNWTPRVAACEAMQATMVETVAETGAETGARRVLLAGAWLVFGEDMIRGLSGVSCTGATGPGPGFASARLRETVAAFEGRGIDVVLVGHPPARRWMFH